MAVEPTNEQIVKMLADIQRELSRLRDGQQRLSAEVGKLTKAAVR